MDCKLKIVSFAYSENSKLIIAYFNLYFMLLKLLNDRFCIQCSAVSHKFIRPEMLRQFELLYRTITSNYYALNSQTLFLLAASVQKIFEISVCDVIKLRL